MHKSVSHPSFGHAAIAQIQAAARSVGVFAVGLAAAIVSSAAPGWTATPATAPPQLKTALAQLDAAANQRNVQAVLQFYSSNFTHSDGLTRQSLQQALTELWKRYPNASYRTELKSWSQEGNSLVAETVTTITGVQKTGNREFTLNSTLQSRQRFENQKIVRQDILAEHSEITSGSKPPTVKLNLPTQVTVGQEYNVDAVVEEPLGDSILLGTAIEEPVKPTGLITPTTADLEVLSAGGIFKVGRAPKNADNRWVSAVLVRSNGMTIVTQRLQVVAQKPTK